MATKRNTLSVYDILEGFDSYIADVETNLKMDQDSWKNYQKNPVPVYVDVLGDFGKVPAGVTDLDLENIARRHAGKPEISRLPSIRRHHARKPVEKVVVEDKLTISGLWMASHKTAAEIISLLKTKNQNLLNYLQSTNPAEVKFPPFPRSLLVSVAETLHQEIS